MTRRVWSRLALAFLALLVAGGLVVWSGVVPIAASSGHWAITKVVLHYAMRRSVKFHSLATEVPDLTRADLILRGAGHYASGCAPCHGAVEAGASEVALQMTPEPPFLRPRIDEWDPEELFWIVRHGVKYTAMPAWPSQQREDEVWSVVAFLLRLPELDPEAYRQLAYGPQRAQASSEGESLPLAALPGPTASPEAVDCVRCHGYQGRGRDGAFPLLAGQSESYLLASLAAYAEGRRHSGFMQPIAAALSAEERQRLARYFAQQSRDRPATSDPQGRGARIAAEGIPESGVPPCSACHGPGKEVHYPFYPHLAGQPEDYLLTQLELFKKERRGGTPFAHIMRSVARHLEESDMRAVAQYYARLPLESLDTGR